jgi:ubiquinone/menaquinone biosynthesis C-methylase UbiE
MVKRIQKRNGIKLNNNLEEEIKKYFDGIAQDRDRWKKRTATYHKEIERVLKFLIPPEASVLDVGCSTGDLLGAVGPARGVGIDLSSKMIEVAKRKYPKLDFRAMNAEDLRLDEKFDYIVLSDLVGFLEDIQKTFESLHRVTHQRSRVVITYYSHLWGPVLKIAEKLHLKMKQPFWQNWLSDRDMENLLYLAGFEVVKKGEQILIPFYIPIISSIFNRYLVKLPILRSLSLVYYIVARPIPDVNELKNKDISVSVCIPARNEKGNIESALAKMPKLGSHTEIIFVEGHSTDGTLEEMKRVKEKYSDADIKIMVQDGKGKGDAVRKGFDAAKGDILMILDADLTVRPEDLPKFYEAIVSGKGEFINGSRLVYPLEKQSMRFLNILGNKFFSLMFSWLLDQRLKDTLCGTKVLWKDDYEKIKKGRKFFGDFDPFGDYDLIFGAAKLNIKIVDLPIRYQARIYGSTNIQRFKHGLILLRMCLFAMRKIKFI